MSIRPSGPTTSHGARPRLHARPAAHADASANAVRARGGSAASGWSCACPRSRSGSLRLQALRCLTGGFFGSAPCQPLGVHARLLGRLLTCAVLGEPALRQVLGALAFGGL